MKTICKNYTTDGKLTKEKRGEKVLLIGGKLFKNTNYYRMKLCIKTAPNWPIQEQNHWRKIKKKDDKLWQIERKQYKNNQLQNETDWKHDDNKNRKKNNDGEIRN